jgi:hypothetical protein
MTFSHFGINPGEEDSNVRLITIFLLVFALCMRVGADTLFPLEPGKFWTYRVTNNSGLTTEPEIINRVVTSVKIGDVTWYQLDEFEETFWIRNSSEGQLEAVNLFDRDGKELRTELERLIPQAVREQLLFKFPVAEGDEWEVFDSTVRYDGTLNISVPAGNFDCHMYSVSQLGHIYSRSCIAENVGIVYSDLVLENGDTVTSRLVKWGLEPVEPSRTVAPSSACDP